MNDSEFATQTVTSSSDDTSFVEATILCLGIVWHPDDRRIGALAPLRFDRTGRAEISRLTPEFYDVDAPLMDRHVSRSSVVLERDSDGNITFTPPSTSMSVTINGVLVTRPLTFRMDELGCEIVVLLGNKVILSIFEAPVRTLQNAKHKDHGLLGISRSIINTRMAIERIANTKLPVLILGETGTGKELVARALHSASDRSEQEMVAVNMAALSPTLASAQLFGSRKGAFTGAVDNRMGVFELANESSLFLDEIGDAGQELQPMLLRTLETGEITPIGEHKARSIDVRIIAATDRNLEATNADRPFNQPLMQRLQGATVTLDPLRLRRVDIGLLVKRFLMDKSDGLPAVALSEVPIADIHRMTLHNWPGNVRELFNAVRRLRLGMPFSKAVETAPYTAAPVLEETRAVFAGAPGVKAYRNPTEIDEDQLIAGLDACDWVIKETAQYLNVSRTSLYQLMASSKRVRTIDEISDEQILASIGSIEGGIGAWAKDLRVGREALRKRIASIKSRSP